MDNAGPHRRDTGLEPPLYDRIVSVICAELAEGRIAEGDRLMESRLAARFGVSRAPARQALGELEANGLVTHAAPPSRGYVVAADAGRRAVDFAAATAESLNFATTPSWQQIYGSVEEAITMRIAFGSWRVVETALGQHHGVSRTVAREVLARLESTGLILNEGKRWIAPKMNRRRVDELYELRALVEPAALESAVRSAPQGMVASMIADLGAAIANNEKGAELDRLERQLHFDLLGHCTNSILLRTVVQNQSLLLAHRFFYRLTSELYPVEPFLAEHLDVLERLQGGDIRSGKEALRDHLIASSERAVERIAKVRGVVRHQPIAYLEPLPERQVS